MASANYHLGIALKGNHWLEPPNFEPMAFCRFQKAVELPLFFVHRTPRRRCERGESFMKSSNVDLRGIEPLTLSLPAIRSSQMSYRPKIFKVWTQPELNRRSSQCECDILPTEL